MEMKLYSFVCINWILMRFIQAISPRCECIIYDKSYGKPYGVFTSPDYPVPYDININCLLYTFIADPDEIVQVSFDEFNVQVNRLQCVYGDYIKLFLHLNQPKVNEYTPWNSVLCGTIEDIDQVYFSAKNTLIFEFHSDWRHGNNTGFRGRYRFLKKKQFVTDGLRVPDTMCDYQFLSSWRNISRGRFFSPFYPSLYPKNSKCSYRFVGKTNQRVRVIFEKVSFDRSDSSCLTSPEKITVRDGLMKNSSVILTICSSKNYIEARSTSPDLYVDFISDTFYLSQGFQATYLFEDIKLSVTDVPSTEPDRHENIQGMFRSPWTTLPPAKRCEMWISSDNTKNGTFTSPNWPSPYPSNIKCKYHFTGRGRERVQILFTHFDVVDGTTDSDNSCDTSSALSVYVTSSGERSRIDDFCGRDLPPKLMSNGPTMTIEFNAMVINTGAKGFRAIYKFVTDFGISGGTQDDQSVCGFVFNSTTSKSGIFQSPNHPGYYPRDTECHYFFHGRPGERVQLTFAFFDVEGIPPCPSQSASDFLEFSNFRTVDRKLARRCGIKKPDSIKSDGDFFRVTFKSNDRLDGRGFSAFYQFTNATVTDNMEKRKKLGTSGQTSTGDHSRGTPYSENISFVAFIIGIFLNFKRLL